MAATTERAPSASATACDACRVRKYKCSKERPSCHSCLRSDRQCHYSGKIIRSPLTRICLTSVERRLHKLEKLFAQYLPDLDLEDALTLTTLPEIKQEEMVDAGSVISSSTEADVNPRDPLSEALPDEADGFEWKEATTDVSSLTDGMAALSVKPTRISYLGMSFRIACRRSLKFSARVDIWCCFFKVSVVVDERCARCRHS
jgi:transcriptional regulatory protein GAL4